MAKAWHLIVKIVTFLDLCSGIGGGQLGLEIAGMKSVGYSDTSKLSVRTFNLMHHALYFSSILYHTLPNRMRYHK